MQEARLIIVEDNVMLSETLAEVLEVVGRHRVVARLLSYTAAIEFLKSPQEFEVAIVDSNLGGGSVDGVTEGQLVVNAIKDSCPGVVVIGNSGIDTLSRVDYNAYKDSSQIIDYIKCL